MITPRAVPTPAVAMAPVWQWCNTRQSFESKPTPCCTNCIVRRRSSASIVSARSCKATGSTGGRAAVELRIRSRAQPRLTAVGRDARRTAMASSRSSPARAAITTPQAAATPIAGAPRTAIVAIASATSRQWRRGRMATSWGNRRWSRSSSCSPVQRRLGGSITVPWVLLHL